MRPADTDAVAALAGVGVVMTVGDDVVALSASSSAERIPTAVTGSHAVAIDLLILLALVGVIGHNLVVARACRRAGTRWSDAISERLVRFDGPPAAVMLLGSSGCG